MKCAEAAATKHHGIVDQSVQKHGMASNVIVSHISMQYSERAPVSKYHHAMA